MILDELQVISPPDDNWVSRLRRGHFVWMIKEKTFAKIEWAWEPPEPGCISGRLGVVPLWRHDDRWVVTQCHSWFIKANGSGLDNIPLLAPVKDNCPDEPLPISDVWQRHVERTLAQMIARISTLERQQDFVER